MNEMTLPERFKYMREERIGLSQQKLADALNIKQQTVANIESGRKQKIDTEILYALLKKFNINSEWLMFGTGNIDKYQDDDDAYETYHNDKIVEIKKYDFSLSEEGNRKNRIDDRYILYFDRRWLKNILGVNPDDIFFIYAPDDSMDSGTNEVKDIKKNDILLVDISKKQGNNNIFVLQDSDNKPFLRQIIWSLAENIKLKPTNNKYKSEIFNDITFDFKGKIIGKVVWNGNKENV